MIRVGTSGYNYPEWRGPFYPERFPAVAMLGFYAARFSTVEINATFYRIPTAATVAAWAAATPAEFVFAAKAPQRITHMRRLRDIDDLLRLFCDTIQALGAKLGPVLFQLPPSFPKDRQRLGDLLFMLPAHVRPALEFRHPSWFDDDVYALLRGRDAALCIADTEAGTSPDVETASWGYLRLRDADYSDAELDAWAVRIARDGWRDAFVYFRHEETAAGPALATRLLARLPGST
jgi:uncharacterized protein YecE (DUF72 family)